MVTPSVDSERDVSRMKSLEGPVSYEWWRVRLKKMGIIIIPIESEMKNKQTATPHPLGASRPPVPICH